MPELHGQLASRDPVATRHREDVEERIRAITARATPLWDRVPPRAPPGNRKLSRKGAARRRRWSEVLGSRTVLAKRLRNAPASADEIAALLEGLQIHGDPPPWTEVLTAVVRAEPAPAALASDRCFDDRRPLPFQDVLLPFVVLGRERLTAAAGDALGTLAEPAVVDLERQLLAHLTFLSSLTLGAEFYDFRFRRAPLSALEGLWAERPASTDLYEAFVERLRGGGLLALMETYPVLARLLCQGVRQWVDSSADLCRRFHADLPELRATFELDVAGPEEALVGLQGELSDRHEGGATVVACTLGSEERLVYKPRSAAPELAFSRVLRWLNDQDLSVELRVPRALDRTTHSWMEWVAAEPCATDAELATFYRTTGAILAALHALAATDVHCENLIASGPDPVVVDLELLLNEGVSDEAPSVLGTGVLPRWQTAPDGGRFDMSALAADHDQDPGVRSKIWQRVNTDQMTLDATARMRPAMDHRPTEADTSATALEQLGALSAGFAEAYETLRRKTPALLADGELVAELDRLDLRILLRDTATYARLHLHLLTPGYLRDALDRSIELEWLARPLGVALPDPAGRAAVYECERLAMERLDIPHFGTRTWAGDPTVSSDEDLGRLFATRSSRVLRERLATFSAADLERQLETIEESLRGRYETPYPAQA